MTFNGLLCLLSSSDWKFFMFIKKIILVLWTHFNWLMFLVFLFCNQPEVSVGLKNKLERPVAFQIVFREHWVALDVSPGFLNEEFSQSDEIPWQFVRHYQTEMCNHRGVLGVFLGSHSPTCPGQHLLWTQCFIFRFVIFFPMQGIWSITFSHEIQLHILGTEKKQ